MHTPDDFLTKFPTRTTDEIQWQINKRDKRNVISRHYHAKDDKEAITAWRLDLNWIHCVFNVCFVTFARRLLTSRFQTELGKTHMQSFLTLIKTLRTKTPLFPMFIPVVQTLRSSSLTSAVMFQTPTPSFPTSGVTLQTPAQLFLIFIATSWKATRMWMAKIRW